VKHGQVWVCEGSDGEGEARWMRKREGKFPWGFYTDKSPSEEEEEKRKKGG